MSANRLFVFGSGRSGTTLLAKLIDSSPEVFYLHEPDKLRPNDKIPFLPEPEDYARYAPEAAQYLDQLFSERLPFVVGKRPLFPKSYRTSLQTRLFSVLLVSLGLAEKARISLPVPELTSRNQRCEALKSVTSVCRVPLFSNADPGMRFIHIVRHPGAVVASLLNGVEQGVMVRNDFFDNAARMSNAGSLGVAPDEVREAGFALRSAYVWMAQNDKTFGEMADSPNYLVVSYEDLCVNMTERLAEICAFAGIDYDTQMSEFVAAMNGADESAGYFSVMRNPVGRISSWEQGVDAETIEAIDQLIGHSAVGRLTLERYRAAKDSLAASAAPFSSSPA